MNDEKPLRFAMTYGKLLIAGEGDGGKRTEKGLSRARGEQRAAVVTACPLLVVSDQTGVVKGDDATCQKSFKATTRRGFLPMNASYAKWPICTMKTVIP